MTAKRALLVIDVQNEYVTGALAVSYPKNTLAQIQNTIKTAQEKEIPVIMIQHTAVQKEAKAFVKHTHGWELHEAVKGVDADLYLEKTFPSAFAGTHLEKWLRKHNIDTVVIAGYMTQHCCDTTARYAYHLGFKVEFLSDATGTLDFENSAGKASGEELHCAVLVGQQFRFSEVMDAAEWRKRVS